MRQKIFYILVALGVLLLLGCENKTGEPIVKTIDWKSLEFTCIKEDQLLPQPDVEAQELYSTANAIYRDGISTNQVELLKRSAELLHRAAQKGHVKAMNNLVVIYLDGDGVEPSEVKAVEWAEELIKRNIGMGYYHMAVFLQQGIGVHQDRKAALTYFRKAADLGNPQGQLVVGDKILGAFAQTDERMQGFAIGKAMLQCALDQGLPEAGYALAKHFEIIDENLPEALIAFQAAAKLGHNQSLYELEQIFLEGTGGVAIDRVRAACYESLSAESDADKTKKFPNIDSICPLPPKPMPY